MDASGQAVIESIFLLPFMIVFFIFIYQSYLILNKAQIAQKALRGSVIRSALNRYDVEFANDFLETGNLNPNGSFAFSYFDAPQGVKYSIDSIVASLILLFAGNEQSNNLSLFFSTLEAPMSLGICLGGAGIMGESISEAVLNSDGSSAFTCIK